MSSWSDRSGLRRHRLLHTRLRFVVDFSRREIRGEAELLVQPLTEKLKHVTVACKGYTVTECAVDGVGTSHTVTHSSLVVEPRTTLRSLYDTRALDLVLCDEADCADAGNLLVKIPKPVKEKMRAQRAASHAASAGDADIDITSVPASTEAASTAIRVTVKFMLSSHSRGLVWRELPDRRWSVMAATARSDPSLWFPCLEAPSDRSSFECAIIVDSGYHAVASGALVSRRFADSSSTRLLYEYECELPIEARHFGLAIAPFAVKTDAQNESVTHFTLPPYLSALHATVPATVEPTLSQLESVLDTDLPFASMSCVWLPNAPFQSQAFAGVCIFDADLLSEATIIDPVYSSWPLIARTIAHSWMTVLIQENPSDAWIAFGLCGWLTAPLLERWFGHNEFEWSAMADAFECVVADGDYETTAPESRAVIRAQVHTLSQDRLWLETGGEQSLRPRSSAALSLLSRPLEWKGFVHPSECDSRLIRVKSSLIFRLLERRLGRASFKKVVDRLVEESCESLDSGVTSARLPLSTARLLDVCREVSGDLDVSAFFSQWITTNGFPLLHCYYQYNAKKKATLVAVHQIQALRSSNLKFMGACKFRIHESERVTEQERRIEEAQHDFEFGCHSKVRRNRKRKHYDASSLSSLSLDRKLARHNDTPVLWMRADTGGAFFQPPMMAANEVLLAAQLSGDKDVRGQADAINAIERLILPTFPVDPLLESDTIAELRVYEEKEPVRIAEDSLVEAVTNQQNFYAVRALAANALVQGSNGKSEDEQARLRAPVLRCVIAKYFRDAPLESLLRSEPATALRTPALLDQAAVRPNDFTDLSDAFACRAFLLALSEARDTDGRTAPFVVSLLLRLLHANDNTGNDMSDAEHIAALLRAIGNLRLAASIDRAPILEQLRRYEAYDRILPSPRFTVTRAVISAACQLESAQQIPRGSIDFAALSRHQHPRVACCAVLAAVRLSSRDPDIWLPIIIDALKPRADANTRVQRTIARQWRELIAQGAVDVNWCREPSAAALQLMDALWVALLDEDRTRGVDERLRTELLALWQLLYDGPRPALLLSSAHGAVSTSFYRELQRVTEERRGDDEDATNAAWRHLQARNALTTARLKRSNTTAPATAASATAGPAEGQAVKFKFKKVGGTLKAADSLYYQNEKEESKDGDGS